MQCNDALHALVMQIILRFSNIMQLYFTAIHFKGGLCKNYTKCCSLNHKSTKFLD